MMSSVPSIMKKLVLRFLTAESGVAAAKYGLIAGVISAAIVTAALGILTKLTADAGAGSAMH
jgi:Flp pilus assembly pilin Flp